MAILTKELKEKAVNDYLFENPIKPLLKPLNYAIIDNVVEVAIMKKTDFADREALNKYIHSCCQDVLKSVSMQKSRVSESPTGGIFYNGVQYSPNDVYIY